MSGYYNNYRQDEKSYNNIVKNGLTDSSFALSNKETNDWKHLAGNINFQHDFKQDGEKLVINLDYIHYYNSQGVQYFTTAYNGNDDFAYEALTRSDKQTPISLWGTAVDYTKKINKKISLEAGLKQTISAFDNDVDFQRSQQNNWVTDPSLSSRYKLREDYSAVYTSFNFSIDQATELKAGLRYEHTNSNLGTATVKDIIDRHYGKIFPSFFISRQLNEDNSANFSYSMRISRPTFNDLAPFTYYSNNNTVITGNAALQPAISNTVKAGYTFKKYLFFLSYSYEKNAITGFQPLTDSITNKLTISPQNMVNLKTISFIIAVPVKVTPWWDMQNNISANWQQGNVLYRDLPVRLQQLNAGINTVQNFRLPKAISLELAGFYQSPQLDGILQRRSFGSLDAGIKKTFPGKKGSLLFSANNILKTLSLREHADLHEQNLSSDLQIVFAQRTFKFTYTRSFGNNNLKEKRQRSTGAEEEKERVH